MAAAVARRFLLQYSLLTLDLKPPRNVSRLRSVLSFPHFSTTITAAASSHTNRRSCSKKKNVKQKETKAAAEAAVKRRTRSDKEFDEEAVLLYGDSGSHIPVMLGEVLEAFAFSQLRSFVDCTVGAAGHSSAIIQAHPEMQLYIGLDVDPIAYEKAQARINTIVNGDSCGSNSVLKAFTFRKNYKDIKYVLHEVDEKLLISGVDGILMDLGMSSMQVNNAERGFSVLCDGPLDMRMNPQGYDRQVLEQKTY